jgi:hypothetical protein
VRLAGVKLGFATALFAAASYWAKPVVPVNGVSEMKISNVAVTLASAADHGSVK